MKTLRSLLALAASCCAVLGSLGFAAALCAAEQPVVVHLKSGAELSGAILEDGFDEARGITLRRDDTGGLLSLRWDQIREEDVSDIKRSRGFIGDEPPPIVVPALLVKTTTGEFIGLKASQDDGKLVLKRRDQLVPIAIDSIRSIQNVNVDALDVEAPEPLFERRRAEVSPTTAVDWYNLGLYAEALGLNEEATKAYHACQDKDPALKSEWIKQRLKLLEVRSKEVEQSDQLNRIKSLKYRQSYREANALAEDFLKKWPNSQLVSLVNKEMADLAAKQRSGFTSNIRTDFFTYLRNACQDKSNEKDITLGAAMTWVRDHAFDDVKEKLAKYYGITTEDVADIFSKRGVGGAPVTASYGGGTFILGEDARKGYAKSEDEKAKEKAEAEKNAKEKGKAKGEPTLQEKINEKLKEKAKESQRRNEQKRKEGEIADIPPTPDDWWAAAAPAERVSFLMAFFAEQTKLVNVLSLDQRFCSTCGGHGWQEQFMRNTGQESKGDAMPCPRCKTLGFDRIVKFR